MGNPNSKRARRRARGELLHFRIYPSARKLLLTPEDGWKLVFKTETAGPIKDGESVEISWPMRAN